jgi:hypothetical protein
MKIQRGGQDHTEKGRKPRRGSGFSRDRTLNDITGLLGTRENRDFNAAFPEKTGAHHPFFKVMEGWTVC